jgi:hypothetical protein
MSKRTSSYLPLLLLALTLAIVHYRLLPGDVLFWGLPSLQFYPWREYAFSLLRQGQLPLWNPFNGAGAPLFANYQSALLYPFTWLGLILPLAQSMSFSAVLHLFFAGWGMWRLLGRLGANGVGRGVSAFAFGMTGYLVARLGTFPIINAAAWLPWQVWAAHDLLTTGNRRAAPWLALFTALQLLTGHAQTAWYSLGIVGLFALWLTVSQRPIHWRRLTTLIGCIGLGAGVAALQLMATAELLGQSQRSGGVDLWTAMNFSYGPARTLNFLSPIIFGTPADGSYLTQGAYFEDAVYIGLIPLVAAIAAIVGWRRRRREALAQSVPIWIVIVIIGFVLALGQYSPIFPFLYEHVPTFDLFQAPVRWHLWTVFGLSLLAGIGATWWRRGGRWTRRLTVACVGAALVSLGMLLFLLSDNPGVRVLIRAVFVTSIFGTLAGWLTLRKPEPGSLHCARWAILVFVVIALDLGFASWGLNPTVPAEFYEPSSEDDQVEREYVPREVERALKFDQYFRFDDYRIAAEQWQQVRQLDLPNMNLMDRQLLLNNFDPLLPSQYVQYINLLENNLQNDALFRAAAVSAVRNQAGSSRTISGEAQRAYLVGSVCWHKTQIELEAALLDPGWQPILQAHLLGNGGCEDVTNSVPGSVSMAHYAANRVILSTQLQRDGWLILADTDYPGWVATVDGEPTPIYRANVLFRAVQVSAGEHTVVFDYSPYWLVPGALVSAVSLLILLLLFRLRNVTPPYNQSDCTQ